MPAKLKPEEVQQFLDSRPGWITLTTLGRDGYPHSVPIGYFRQGEEIVIGCIDGTQKVKNVQRDPRVSLSLESGGTMQDIKGVLIQGDARAVVDPKEKLHYAQAGARRRGVVEADLPKEASARSAYIVVRPRKVISWDYSRSE